MKDIDNGKINCDHFMCGLYSDGRCLNCNQPVNLTVYLLKMKEYCVRMLNEKQKVGVVE